MSTSNLSTLLSSSTESVFIYGTAWKKDRTTQLVKDAIAAGFRRIDTAAQPRHYQESMVGNALREVLKEGSIKREDIYLQTKYTTPAGQDLNNMPYHPLDPLETQIHTSVASSLNNFRLEDDSDDSSYLDCLLLHSPLPTIPQTLEAWKLLEIYVPHKIRKLGISNVTLPILETIYDNSSVKPSVVQNRFYPATKYDNQLRAFCRKNNIAYQSFWTLTGNPKLLASEPVHALTDATSIGNSIALYSLVMNLGVIVLNGTTSTQHMREDLDGIEEVRHWAQSHESQWSKITSDFGRLIGQPHGGSAQGA